MTLVHQMLATTAARLPEKTALVKGNCALSCAEIDELVECLASGLQSHGVRS